MSNPYQWNTIDDLLQAAYGDPESFMLGRAGTTAKADAPALTTSTNYLAVRYGATAFRNLNDQVNTWGVIGKVPFKQSGVTVTSANGSTTAHGSLAEAATLPDSVLPTKQRFSAKPKEVVHKFDTSTKMQFLATKTGDDAATDHDTQRQESMALHMTDLDKQITLDANTVASNRFESIDRVCASNGEVALVDANDLDIYGLDRDAGASFADAYVSHNSGTARFFTDALLLDALDNSEEAGADTSVILTGTDTKASIMAEYGTQIRYNVIGSANVRASVNGIQTADGVNYGKKVATVYDFPLIKDHNLKKDTITRIYGLDLNADAMSQGMPRVAIKIAVPTMYFETGPNVNNRIFESGGLVNRGLFYTSGELHCGDFSKQFKLRDMK